MQYAVGVDFKLHPYARDAFWRRIEFDGELAEAPVVRGAVPLPLQNMNEHAALMVHRRGEHFAGLQGDRGVARNNDVHQAAERFDAERQRRHVEQQHVLEAARENFRLNRRAQRDRFVGILRRVEQRAYRLAAYLAGDRHVAAGRLGDHVEGEVVLIRAALAEAFDLGVDQPRVQRVQLVPAEAELLDRAGRHVLDEDIGLRRHLLDQREPARRFEVDRHRLLVGVVDHEIIGVGTGLRAGTENAPGFAALRVFHLDDLGAELGQHLGAGRTGLELRQVEHPHSGKTIRCGGGIGHRQAPSVG